MKYRVHTKIVRKSQKRIVAPARFHTASFNLSYKTWINRKTKTFLVKSREQLTTVLDKIFENAAHALTERDGGVVLEGIGYFAFRVSLTRRFNESVFPGGRIVHPSYETDYYTYTPHMFTDVFNVNYLKGWSMKKSFNRSYRDRLKKRKFKIYYKEVKAIYKQKYIQWPQR